MPFFCNCNSKSGDILKNVTIERATMETWHEVGSGTRIARKNERERERDERIIDIFCHSYGF